MSSMTKVTMKELKSKLRSAISAKLDRLTSIEIEKQSTLVCETLFQLPEFQQAKRVGLYLSMPKEVDTFLILKKCFNDRKQCFVPRYTPKNSNMQLVEVRSLEDYETLPIEPKWKIKQPDWNDLRVEALSTGGLDILLVPGVAFTTTGLRLGHGKGYYDRWLSKCFNMENIQRPITIGLALREQIVDDLPVSQFDIPINKIIYPQ